MIIVEVTPVVLHYVYFLSLQLRASGRPTLVGQSGQGVALAHHQ